MPKKLNKEEFIIKANLTHNNKYDYSNVIYTSNKEKVSIICPEHNVFSQTPHSHLKGYGCTKCGRISMSDKIKVSKADFITRSNIIHNNKYDYTNVIFNITNDKIEIICPIHGMFSQKVYGHLTGRGCSKCKQSKGENMVGKILDDKKIKNLTQHKFDDCINPKTNRKLLFDFYLPELNICVEYDGEQHYIVNNYFNHDKLEMRQKRDQIKNEYCLDNNIRLIRIKYDENIKDKLNELF